MTFNQRIRESFYVPRQFVWHKEIQIHISREDWSQQDNSPAQISGLNKSYQPNSMFGSIVNYFCSLVSPIPSHLQRRLCHGSKICSSVVREAFVDRCRRIQFRLWMAPVLADDEIAHPVAAFGAILTPGPLGPLGDG